MKQGKNVKIFVTKKGHDFLKQWKLLKQESHEKVVSDAINDYLETMMEKHGPPPEVSGSARGRCKSKL